MGKIIAGHNKKILNAHYDKINKENGPAPKRTCNCPRNKVCPLAGECLLRDVMYKGTASANNTEDKEYIGISAPEFKFRYNNHNKSFRHEKYSQETTLSAYVWELKRQGINPSVSFEIMRVVPSFTPETGVCALCTAEKLAILKADKHRTLNSRSELTSKCRHKSRFFLEKIT